MFLFIIASTEPSRQSSMETINILGINKYINKSLVFINNKLYMAYLTDDCDISNSFDTEVENICCRK